MPKLTRASKIRITMPAKQHIKQLYSSIDELYEQLDTSRVCEHDTPFSIQNSPSNYCFKSNSNMKNSRRLGKIKASEPVKEEIYSSIPAAKQKIKLFDQKTNFDSDEKIEVQTTKKNCQNHDLSIPLPLSSLKSMGPFLNESDLNNKYLPTEESNWSYGDNDIMDLI